MESKRGFRKRLERVIRNCQRVNAYKLFAITLVCTLIDLGTALLAMHFAPATFLAFEQNMFLLEAFKTGNVELMLVSEAIAIMVVTVALAGVVWGRASKSDFLRGMSNSMVIVLWATPAIFLYGASTNVLGILVWTFIEPAGVSFKLPFSCISLAALLVIIAAFTGRRALAFLSDGRWGAG